MPVLQNAVKHPDGSITCEWYATEVGDRVENPNGVQSTHETNLLSGEALLECEGKPPKFVSGGETIILPTNTAYSFQVSLSPCHVQCEYPSAAAGEVEALLQDPQYPRVWDDGRIWGEGSQ